MNFSALSQSWLQRLTRGGRDYPLTLLASVGVFVCLVFHSETNHAIWITGLKLSVIAIPLTVMGHFYAHYDQDRTPSSIALWSAIAALLALLGWDWRTEGERLNTAQSVHFVTLWISLHTGVAIIPFFSHARFKLPNRLWEINRRFVLALLFSLFFALLLWCGLALTLFAVEKLFDIRLYAKTYKYLFYFLGSIFLTAFFISEVTSATEEVIASEHQEFPSSLRQVTRWVFLPLVLIDIGIVYAYVTKLVIQTTAPEIWMSWLILPLGGIGILLYLLLFPLRRSPEEGIITQVHRWLFPVLFPLALLQFYTALTHLGRFGATEPRMVMLALSGWLLGISLWGIAKKVIKKDDITVLGIPLSLGIVGLSCAALMVPISERAQRLRLELFLESNDMVVSADSLRPMSPQRQKTLKESDIISVRSIILYLDENHSLPPNLSARLRAIESGEGSEGNSPHLKSNALMSLFEELNLTVEKAGELRLFIYSNTNTFETTGADYIIAVEYSYFSGQSSQWNEIILSEVPPPYSLSLRLRGDSLVVTQQITQKHGSEKAASKISDSRSVSIPFSLVLDSLLKRHHSDIPLTAGSPTYSLNISPKAIELPSLEHLRTVFIPKSLSAEMVHHQGGSITPNRIESVSGYILFSLPPKGQIAK